MPAVEEAEAPVAEGTPGPPPSGEAAKVGAPPPPKAAVSRGPGGSKLVLKVSDVENGKIIEVETALSDSVSKFKNKVHEKGAQWEPDRQRLFIGELELGDRRIRLEDETKTLREYGVERLSALTLESQDPTKAKERRDDRCVPHSCVVRDWYGSDMPATRRRACTRRVAPLRHGVFSHRRRYAPRLGLTTSPGMCAALQRRLGRRRSSWKKSRRSRCASRARAGINFATSLLC